MIEALQETGETNQETDMKEEETVTEKEMIENQKAGIPKMILGTKKMIAEGQKTRDQFMKIHLSLRIVKEETEIEMKKGTILPTEEALKDQETQMVKEDNHLHQEEIKMEGVIQEE